LNRPDQNYDKLSVLIVTRMLMAPRMRALHEETFMKKTLTAVLAVATMAVTLAGTTTSADAYWRRYGGWGFGPGIAAGILGGAIIGSAIASSRAYPPPPGWAYYPAYAEPVPAEGCYWARMPVYDPAGNVVAWRGRPRLICPPY
jgi:hypothetical protein